MQENEQKCEICGGTENVNTYTMKINGIANTFSVCESCIIRVTGVLILTLRAINNEEDKKKIKEAVLSDMIEPV
ncbi:MAG: hypothetical protein QXY18_07290, partial [Nitrososphaerota archaeon]